MGLNINGKVIIYKNTYGYSTTISNKNQNGEYERMYISVQLPKEINIENKTKINIEDGFLSFYKSKDGLPKIKLVVLKLKDNYENEEREAIQNESNYNLDYDSDLPF